MTYPGNDDQRANESEQPAAPSVTNWIPSQTTPESAPPPSPVSPATEQPTAGGLPFAATPDGYPASPPGPVQQNPIPQNPVAQIPVQPSFQAPSFESPAPPPSFPTSSYEPPAPTSSYEPPAPTSSYEPPAPTSSYEPPAAPSSPASPSEAPGPSWSTFGGQPADPVPPPMSAPQYQSGPPTIGQPAVGPVTGGQPTGVGQPYVGQPGVGQPYAGQPYAGQPGTGQPYAGQPYAGVPSAPTYDPAAMAQPYSVQPYSVAPASGAYPYGVPSAIPMVEPKRRRTGVVVLSILTTLFVLATGVMTTLFVLTKQERDRLDTQVQRLGVETTDQRQNISTIQTNLENTRRDLADSQAETKEVADQKAKLSACIKAFEALITELNKTNPSTTVLNRLDRAFVRACNEADKFLD